jgi:hypothetical protein
MSLTKQNDSMQEDESEGNERTICPITILDEDTEVTVAITAGNQAKTTAAGTNDLLAKTKVRRKQKPKRVSE